MGGGADPSRSAGRKLGSLPPPLMPGVMKVAAGLPASMALRSNTNACGPRNAVPEELKMFMAM